MAFLRALLGEQVRLFGVDISVEHTEWDKRKSPDFCAMLDPACFKDNYESSGVFGFEARCLPLNWSNPLDNLGISVPSLGLMCCSVVLF